ncbi:hypothetical protein ARMSODRAFT_114847 [Armillaria solidipes]|uniref:Uncharacterized protein n=1 Tax=Armillaria solidipes TaxID=1076256 RepID=A0A2H3C2Y0_9AGAR|nr:hypothetical protein ARMSODRAFT_114847 [Armillaria solidipes]
MIDHSYKRDTELGKGERRGATQTFVGMAQETKDDTLRAEAKFRDRVRERDRVYAISFREKNAAHFEMLDAARKGARNARDTEERVGSRQCE